MTPVQREVLRHLRYQNLMAHELRDRMGLRKIKIEVVLSQMEREGLVHRVGPDNMEDALAHPLKPAYLSDERYQRHKAHLDERSRRA